MKPVLLEIIELVRSVIFSTSYITQPSESYNYVIDRSPRKVKLKRLRTEKHIKLILICFRNQTYQNAIRYQGLDVGTEKLH